MHPMRICKEWFSGFEWKDVPFPLIHTFMLRGGTVELEVAELLPLLQQRNTQVRKILLLKDTFPLQSTSSSQETATDLVSIYRKQ